MLQISIIVGIGWTFLQAASLYSQISHNYSSARDLAIAEARFHLMAGHTLQNWLAGPNDSYSLLSDTAVATRKTIHIYDSSASPTMSTGTISGHTIEGSKPDAWDSSALQAIQEGAAELMEFAKTDDQLYLRLMRPIRASDGCLNCHARSEFKNDPILGGVSISIPAGQYMAAARRQSIDSTVWQIIFWLLGIIGLTWAYGAISEREKRNREDYQALANSERRVSLALAGADLGTWDWDIKTGHVTYDERWAQMVGYRVSELEPSVKTWEKLLHPDDAAEVMTKVQEHLDKKTSQYETEHRLRHKSGEWIWVLDRGQVIEWDNDGLPRRACGTHLNITQRKQAELLLNSEAARRRVLLQQSKDGIVVFDDQTRVLEASTSFAEMLGYSHDEAVNLHAYDWDAQYTREEVLAMAKSVDAAGLQFETKHRRKDGSVFDVDVRINAVYFNDQKLIFGIHRDISKSKQAERKLAETVSLLLATLESTADGILVVDREGKVSTLNRRFLEMWCIPPEIAEHGDDRELLGMVLDQLLSPDQFLEKVKQLYDTPEAESFDVLHFKDGRVFERYSTAQRIGNDIVGRVWSFRDVTERVKAEQEREELRDQYFQAQKMEAIGQLAGGVAHDFNNLLQVMQGYTEYAAENNHDESRIHTSLAHVMAAVQRAKGLVSQLLTFSRRKALSYERFELDTALSQLLKMVDRLIGQHIELDFRPNARGRCVRADRGLIEQAVLNMCVNARDAMPDGGRLTIATNCVADISNPLESGDTGTYICMAITDTGCGMNDETLKHIFEPFFTTKELGKGTGLGLASVFGAVKQHGGFIKVESQPGQGSRFEVYLPVSLKEFTEDSSDTRVAVLNGHETVLVAEDDDIIRNLTGRILTKAGYSVLLARDGEEALEIFNKQPDRIDLLLLDLMMPKKRGHEVYIAAKQIRPGIPTLFASGYSKEALDMNLGEDDSTALIQKPYRREQLLIMVREVLRQKSTEPA